MKMIHPRLLVLLLALGLATPCFAAGYTERAIEAFRSGSSGWTVYVDVTFGLRKRVAASELNKAHLAFSEQGFEPVSVDPHSENGDLQGFFVTYRRSPTR